MDDLRAILPEEQSHFEKYYRYESLFSAPECDALIALAEGKGMQPGKIGNGSNTAPVLDPLYRNVLTARIYPADAPWAFERLITRTQWVNGQYKFNLNGMYEDIGIMRYDAPSDENPNPGKYNWHQDFGGGVYSRRKISVVGLLSEPSGFQGGELHLFNESDMRADLSKRGDTVFFPSWTPHCVTPMLAGRRYSLVAWVAGPRFR